MKRKNLLLQALWMFIFLIASHPDANAEELSAAVTAGKATALFSGTGGSSGDAVILVVAKTPKAGSGTLKVTISPGTWLRSGSKTFQSMVIASVRGRVVNENQYEPMSVIEVSEKPTKYILEVYCAEFEKENPSSKTVFILESPDPAVACIMREGATLSTQAKQAAVWIYTDNVSFKHMNEKFSVDSSDWAAAKVAVGKCTNQKSQPRK